MLNAPHDLRCERRINPLGIGRARPRLSWLLNDARRGARQTAYQLQTADSAEAIEANASGFDTGRVEGEQSAHVEYPGPPLRSRERVWWRVRTWDGDDQASPWSAPAGFEIGLLQPADWSAAWIAAPIVGGPYSIPPAAYLRTGFDVSRPVRSARLYVTALGIHEFEINGRRVSDQSFAPGRTEYARRVPYHVYDVAALLHDGPNACGAILGDGWYCGHLHSDPRQTYGDRPRLRAQLEITYADGSTDTVATGQGWRAGEGPIRSSDMLMGEDYDARMEIDGWSTAAFDDSAWRPVLLPEAPSIAVVAARAPPVRPIEEIRPVGPPKVSANKRRHLFDMGQNMVGRVRLRIRNAPPGRTIDLRYAEMLDKDGKPYTTALRTARATDHYTTRGGADEVFEPRFTFHGFRYVEVRDYPGGVPTEDELTGVVLHSDCERTGEFECSDALVNQLQHNIVWSQKGNFLDIPTDCPQRDERLGWTGDAQVFIRTAAFNMDVDGFFAKWLVDMADTQALAGDGRIHSVVPGVSSINSEGGPAWADAAIICPWTLYRCYGDEGVLRECWPMMERFMGFLAATSPGHVRAGPDRKWRGYGDWLSIDAHTPQDLIGVAFYAYDASLMARMAGVLGDPAAVERYAGLAEEIRATWCGRYLKPDGTLSAATQTAAVLALHFDLLPEASRPAVLEWLVRDIADRSMHLSTGFVGTPYLNPVLTRFGRADVAYALLHQRTFPSWLFPVTHGATTMWERWDGWTPEKGFNDAGMNSYNHYAYGAVGEWLYAAVGGIDLHPEIPGYRHSIIRPHPRQSGLSWARASLRTSFGVLSTHWHRDGDRFALELTIPPNTRSTVVLPARDAASAQESGNPVAQADGVELAAGEHDRGTVRLSVGAGTYSFRSLL